MTNYEKFKFVKQTFISKNSLNYFEMISTELNNCLFHTIDFKTMKYRTIFYNLFRFDHYKFQESHLNGCDNLIVYSLLREDYHILLDHVFKSLNRSKLLDLNKILVRQWSFFSGVINSLKTMSMPWFFTAMPFLNLKEKLYIVSILVFNMNTIAKNAKKLMSLLPNSDLKRLVAFNSCYNIDLIVSKIFISQDIKVISLQHGVLFAHKNKHVPYNFLNYENQVADTYCVWSDYSKDELVRLNHRESRILVGGYPYPFKRQELPDVDKPSVIIFLARKYYHDDNMRLLDLVKKVNLAGFKIFIKCHPYQLNEELLRLRNDFNVLEAIEKSQTLNPNEFQISISFNTTIYYESMLNGQFAVTYQNENFEGYLIDNNSFTNSDELNSILESYHTEKKGYLKKSDDFLNNVIGHKTNNYNNINYI